MQRALESEPLTIYGDGEQTRDFIYVKDVVAANVFVATTPGLSGVFNVGNGGQMTIAALAMQIIELAKSTSAIHFAPERAGDIRHSQASIEKLRAAGFHPKGSVIHGLEKTLDSLRLHKE
jgi:UDP-glucose 4-epimerase